jgi:hypothetical protein
MLSAPIFFAAACGRREFKTASGQGYEGDELGKARLSPAAGRLFFSTLGMEREHEPFHSQHEWRRINKRTRYSKLGIRRAPAYRNLRQY